MEEIKIELTKEGVLAEIGMITQQISLIGFNDHEIPTLNRLKENVTNGTIELEDALKQAYFILNNKQDYH